MVGCEVCSRVSPPRQLTRQVIRTNFGGARKWDGRGSLEAPCGGSDPIFLGCVVIQMTPF